MNKNDITTDALHTPYPQRDPYGSLSFPVYHTAAYEFDTAEEMAAAFTGKVAGHTYSRISNPTVKHFEDCVQNITGAFSVTALNSGMAAISNTFFTIAQSGSNIVASPHLFGNTYSLFNATFRAFSIEVRFCDFSDIKAIEEAIDPATCAVYCELISNPQMEVVDLQAISQIAKQRKVPFIVDTTVVPFCAFRAKEWGIDIEIVSSTKYISGGATSLGGLIIDYATYDWTGSPKLKTAGGKDAFTSKLKKEIHRNLGAYMTPQVAYQQAIGLETLALRFDKAQDTAFELAQLLESLPQVKAVNYPGLRSNRYYEISKSQFNGRAGAMFTFELDSQETCFKFLNKLKVIKRATNLFDNKSLAIHPASTIYGTFTEEERNRMDVFSTTIRISIGLESVEMLFEDIKQALE